MKSEKLSTNREKSERIDSESVPVQICFRLTSLLIP